MRFVGGLLRAYREHAALTQVELGKACGKPASQINRLELGACGSPRAATLKPIADALGVRVEDMFVDDDEKPGARTINIVVHVHHSAAGDATTRRLDCMARCIEAAEQTINSMIEARRLDDGTWARLRAGIIRPWATSIIELEACGGPVPPGAAAVRDGGKIQQQQRGPARSRGMVEA